MTTLYKTCRMWSCQVQDSTITISHGLTKGNHQTEVIVRPNPASAKLEAESRISKKILREGYTLSPESRGPQQPMLLQQFRTFSHKLPSIVYYQPKLNGYRCVASSLTMMSRKDTPIFSMPHIQHELAALPDDIVLDGELYCHGMSLQETGSYVRCDSPKSGCDCIEYHVFDVQSHEVYSRRYDYLQTLRGKFNFIKIVPAKKDIKEHSDNYLSSYTSLGYEGVVLRDPMGKYEKDTRSYSVQKLKPLFSDTFRVTGITAATKGREKGAAIVECVTASGKSFRARMTGQLGTRQHIYTHRASMLPAVATISFEDYTDDGIPQHPRCTELLV